MTAGGPATKAMISTRENAAYKWQKSSRGGVIGCLEVPSEPELHIRAAEFRTHVVHPERFAHCWSVWQQLALQKDFVDACDMIPAVKWLGCLTHTDRTIRKLVDKLNGEWVEKVNAKLDDFCIDLFNWHWMNATGKAETNILLIRFLEKAE